MSPWWRRPKPSPVRVTVGGDRLARAGERAQVFVTVEGEEPPVGLSVYLRLLGWDNKRAQRWPLGELAPELGTQALAVELPVGLAPACVRFAEYSFCADLKRREGHGVTGAADVDVIARPEDVFWPDGARSAGSVSLDAEVVELGGVVSGRVAGAETVEVGPALDRGVGLRGATAAPRFHAVATAPVTDGAFSVPLPRLAPPTLYDGGEQAIVWEVRAGDAWHRFAVLDPEGWAGRRDGRTPELLSLLAALAGDRLF